MAEPDRHDWRVLDAALGRITCEDCGQRLSRGPMGCAACDLAHGFRYAAVESEPARRAAGQRARGPRERLGRAQAAHDIGAGAAGPAVAAARWSASCRRPRRPSA
ncbi:hypothetical protein [Saccharopolyspora erythraea]|uniref:hypothetical protein n=1 Tax=Saccharopolyspora erythraea TaxID=1836 RepID=UPI00031FA45D|nr:hypothetical protein [Saccharopolyspora erythraea]QRK91592.1 hypothetical protein JQX30_09520 [Saccharopolyspora erythraea]